MRKYGYLADYLTPERLYLLLVTPLIVFIVWKMWTVVIGAIYVPTPMYVVEKMLEIAEVVEGDTLIDLGSGDGRIIIEAAERYGVEAVGIEADPLRVLWSRRRVRVNGLQGRVRVVWGDFFRSDLSKATVVTVYQGQGINSRLKAVFSEMLDPGTRVVSYAFTFDGWEPLRMDPDAEVYLYMVQG